MDIYNHLIDNLRSEQKPKETKRMDQRFYTPPDMRDMEKQRYYKNKRNKNSKDVVAFQKSNIIFLRPWEELNKAQKMSRLVSFAKQNGEDRAKYLTALERRQIASVDYDSRNGHIISIELKE